MADDTGFDTGFDAVYRLWQDSESRSDLLGEGMPAAIEPFSFVPLDGLAAIVDLLALEPGQTLGDLGSGRGGPGLWLAARAEAALIGVDSSAVAVADARRRQALFPGVREARFAVADVADTGLPDACCDAVVSVDVLQLVDDQPAMLREAARLVRHGGRLVFTTWEGRDGAPDRFPRDVAGLLADAGLTVDAVTERPAWQARQSDIYARAADLGDGDPAVAGLAEEGRQGQEWHHALRRVLVTAHRMST